MSTKARKSKHKGSPAKKQAARSCSRRTRPSRWNERYKELKSYRRKNRNCDVPFSYAANPSLARWVNVQRLVHKRGELSEDRIERLSSLGFTWSSQKHSTDQRKWDKRFKELKEYKRKRGNCDVPNRYTDNPPLGQWVHKQRQRKGKLSTDCVKRLEGIGLNWGKTLMGWDERFKELEAYTVENGDCNVPARYPANPQLGKWVSMQRYLHKRGKLSQGHVVRLEELVFQWAVRRGPKKSAHVPEEDSNEAGSSAIAVPIQNQSQDMYGFANSSENNQCSIQ